MDVPEVDSFLSTCKQLAIALFPDCRHRVRISIAIVVNEGITARQCLQCFCQHFSGCSTIEEVADIMYRTKVSIGEFPLSTIYAVARGAENARRGVIPNCPSSSSLLSLFLYTCLLEATGNVAWILREMLELEHPEPNDEETPMQRLAAKMSSTIIGVEKDLVVALTGDKGNFPDGMGYSRPYLKKTAEITEGIATVKGQLDELARGEKED